LDYVHESHNSHYTSCHPKRLVLGLVNDSVNIRCIEVTTYRRWVVVAPPVVNVLDVTTANAHTLPLALGSPDTIETIIGPLVLLAPLDHFKNLVDVSLAVVLRAALGASLFTLVPLARGVCVTWVFLVLWTVSVTLSVVRPSLSIETVTAHISSLL
jgi:hypothetical protein